jgi:hypothetical protein
LPTPVIRALTGIGLDFHDIADLVASHVATKIEHATIIDYPSDWRDMVKWLILNSSKLTAADLAFVFGLQPFKREPDAKQCSRLRTLYAQQMRGQARA